MTVTVIDTLGPKNDGDFAVTEDTHQKGGWHAVADITARDAIPTARRKDGLIAYVVSEQKAYVWLSSAWQEFTVAPSTPGHAYELEESIVVQIDQVSGVNPTLTKPLTRQSEVPATAFQTFKALMAAMPQIIPEGLTVTIQLRSDLRPDSPTDVMPYLVPPIVCGQTGAGVGGIIIEGERNNLFTGLAVSSATDAWRINFAGTPFTASALKGYYLLVTGGTGAGQEILIRDNGTNWVELLTKSSPVLTATSVVDIWSPKWRMTGSTNDVAAHAYYPPMIPAATTKVAMRRVTFDGYLFQNFPLQLNYGGFPISTSYCWIRRAGYTSENAFYFQISGNLGFSRCWLKDLTSIAAGYGVAVISDANVGFALASYLSVRNSLVTGSQCWWAEGNSALYLYDTYFEASATAPGMTSKWLLSAIRGARVTLESGGSGPRGINLGTTGGVVINCSSVTNLAALGIGVSRTTIGGARLELVAGVFEVQNALCAIDIGRPDSSLVCLTTPGACKTSACSYGYFLRDGVRLHIPANLRLLGSVSDIQLEAVNYAWSALDALGTITANAAGTSIAIAESVSGHYYGTVRAGAATFSAESSKAVTFPVRMLSTSYAVALQAGFSTAAKLYPSSLATSGFTINSDIVITGTVYWTVVQYGLT